MHPVLVRLFHVLEPLTHPPIRPKWAPTFRKVWTQSWDPWVEYVEAWYNIVTPEDLHHAACFRIPLSFDDQLPEGHGAHFWERVAHHQYMMLHMVRQLRKEFTMPPRDEPETQAS